MTVQELLDALLALPEEMRSARVTTAAGTCGFDGIYATGVDEYGAWVLIE